MTKIIEKYDLELIANELEKIKKVKGGNVNFEAFRFEDYLTILQSAIIFNKGFPECEKRSILTKSLFSCGREGKISSKKLLKKINYNEGIFLNSSKTKYKLVTSISVKYIEMLKPVKDKGFNLRFYPQLPNKYDQTEIKEKLRYSNAVIIPPEYTVVVISTEGRTTHEAVENAISFFDFIRGIWNFYNNRLTHRRMVSGKHIPVNEILFGPIHTLHSLDGKLATNDHWYEVLYSDEIKASDIRKNFNSIKSQEKITRERIKKNPYGEELRKIFIRYNNALDVIDLNTSIVNLWSILEYLTNTTEKSYAQTISRATFIFRDYKIVKQFLETFRDVRNKIVHLSERDDRGEILVYQLKNIVENLFLFHLNNKFQFAGIVELGNFLDLPKQSSALSKKFKIIKSGINFKQVKV
jgi:hypothetical protein